MRSPPLGELYDLLRADGFAIGVDDHVRIGRLVARDAAWTPEMLKISIAALVVTDPHERTAFDACWERWMRSAESSPPPEVARPALPAAKPSTARRRSVIGRAVAIVVAVVAVVLPVRSCADAPVHGGGSGDQSPNKVGGSGDQSPVKVAGSGDQPQISEGAQSPLAPQTTVPAPNVPPPPSRTPIDVALVALALGMIVLAIAATVGALGARARRRFVPGPWRYVLAVPPATQPVLSRNAIEDAAADLTWQTTETGDELDFARSVAATVACGGLPTLVYRRPPAAPRYLVLADTASGADRWKFVYDELLRGLALLGVELERYTFVANPEQCIGPDGRIVGLGDLFDHTDALIVIGDGDAAVDPLTGDRAEWLALLRHVPRRLWINPVPPARWSVGAHAIAADTPMEHGVALALAALNAGVDRRVHSDHPYPAVIERAPGTASTVAALRAALGDRAFLLVAAVAVTGAPTLAAARWLTETHALELDEQDWLGVATLPWFRTEQWPEGLRDRLSEALGADAPGLARAIATTSQRLFSVSEPPRGSGAHLAWQLEGAYRAGRRGERAATARVLNQVTGTPLAYQARGQLAALGLPDRARRALVSALVVGAALVIGAAGAILVIALNESSIFGHERSRVEPAVHFEWASVHIESVPAGAVLLFDGTRLSDQTPLTIDGVPGGTRHSIRVELADYESYEETIEIPRNGTEVSVTANLKPITGKRVIDSVLPDAPAAVTANSPLDAQAEPSAGNCPAGMVPVPAGTFWMGSPDSLGAADEHPQHEVTLTGYCIDKTEVTVKAYGACVAAQGCSAAPLTVSLSGYSADDVKLYSQLCNGDDRSDHPINCVDWDQADAYCRWVGKQAGGKTRLPTEAEWEYAARGNDGRAYPWGNDAPSAKRLNACGTECVAMAKRLLNKAWGKMYDASDGWETTAPVGSFPEGASPFGVLDMAGNVWEWTADWSGPYSAAAATNPRGAETGTARVGRGGGWYFKDAGAVRAALRFKFGASIRLIDVGFRCARGD